jgi:hypothetical protein
LYWFVAVSTLLLHNVTRVRPCVAAKKEDEELKAQKDAGASKGQQQQQQRPNQDTLAEPTSSSATAAKAALSSPAVTGGIAFAARSHQGIAEKAKEVRLLAHFKQACLYVDLESCLLGAMLTKGCLLFVSSWSVFAHIVSSCSLGARDDHPNCHLALV